MIITQKQKRYSLRIIAFLLAFALIFPSFGNFAAQAASGAGKIVMSFEVYDPADKAVVLLTTSPTVLEFSPDDTGISLMKKALGNENVDAPAGWINSLTFDGIGKVGTKDENFGMSNTSWSLYLNNAEAMVAAGEYKPQDGDVYRVIFTSYDSLNYAFPAMENNLDALYWAIAEAAAKNANIDEALSLIQSAAPAQSDIDAATVALSDKEASHRICIDGRTISINRSTNPFTATPTLSADKTSASSGEKVTVTVNPPAGKQLVSGSLMAGGVKLTQKEGSLNQYTFIMPDAHVAVTAQYENNNPDAGKLLGLWFALDEKGDTKVPLTPEFSPNRTDRYEITFYDSQLTANSTNFYIWTRLSQGASAKLRYTMGPSSGMAGTYDGPVLASETAKAVKRSTIFAYGNGLDQYIRVTSATGDSLDYTIKMSLLPVLKSLKITYGDGTDATWDTAFSPTAFKYQLEVPDDATEITLTPGLQTTSNKMSLNGAALTNNAAKTIVLDPSGVTQFNLKVEDKGAENLFTTYTLTIKQPKATLAKWQTVDAISEKIASSYADISEGWKVMDLAAYGKLNPDSKLVTSDTARQNFINKAVAEVDDSDANVGTFSKYIITLKSIGIDASKLFTPNGSTMRNIDTLAKLRSKNISSVFDAPWVLIANQQGNLNLTQQEIKNLVKIIKDNQGEGLFGYTWAGETYDDPDTAGVVLAALAPYYLAEGDEFGVKEDVKEIVAKAVSALKAKQLSTGSLGSANTDAFVIIGLTAIGMDPDRDFVKSGNSLLDGLLSYALADKSGFGFTSNTSKNELATEQGFRALVAATAYQSTNQAFNIYDFSANPSNPGRATGSAEVQPPAPPVSDKKITVFFTLQGMDSAGYKQTWISGKSLSTPDDSTVTHVILKALEGTGYKQVGAESGYIRSVTTPSGYKLSEMQEKWPNSGWLYSVNSTYPLIGISDYILKNNDRVELYFAQDYTQEPSSKQWSGTSSGSEQPKQPASVAIKPDVTVTGGNASASVSQKDITGALASAKDSGSSSVNISVETNQNINSLNLTLASSAIKDLAKSSNMAVSISSPVGTVSLPNKAINAIVSQAGSADVQISMNTKSPSDVQLAGVDLTGACIVELTVKAGSASITKFDGEKLNVTVPVSDSYKQGESYKVVVISADGSVKTYVGTVLVKNQKPSVNILIPHLSTFVVTKEKLAVYSDVPQGAWYYEAVQDISLRNLMKGTGDNKFSPDANMTRAMLVTVLYHLEGNPVLTAANNFSDVKSGQWYTDAVLWAKHNGIVAGYENGLFGTDDSITRQQMAVMLYRYAQYKGYDVNKSTELSAYKDTGSIAAWALNAMKWANSEGLINGTSAASLSPDSSATRAQVATVLMNFCGNILE